MKRGIVAPALALALALLGAHGCYMREPAPIMAPRDATGGFAPPDFDAAIACGSWQEATDDIASKRHTAFADMSPDACFVGVEYADVSTSAERVSGMDVPLGDHCGYPTRDTASFLLARASLYDAVAASPRLVTGQRVPLELACSLPDDIRAAAAQLNSRTLKSYAGELEYARDNASITVHPYAVAATFGYGHDVQNTSALLDWRPGGPCVSLDAAGRDLLSVNIARATRVADAYRAGLAPLVSVSGGAVHARIYEAFMLAHLVICDGAVPAERVLVDPCADHTHTNVRNTGAIVIGVGGRTAYVVTDDAIQSDYLQEWTAFDLVGGGIDQRALRDWGYLLGAWRQASRGMDAGFWFSPYRFFAEPVEGLGSFHCLGDVVIGKERRDGG